MLQGWLYEKEEELRGSVAFRAAQFLIVPFLQFGGLTNTMAMFGVGCIFFPSF